MFYRLFFCERRRIRTFDRLLRRQVLYPTELCVLGYKIKKPPDLSGFKVNAEGFEPSTACLEGRCSIQLSYASICFKTLWKVLSGWQDSNLRPPAPKAGAITGLRYTPKAKIIKRRDRDSNPGTDHSMTV